MVMRVSFAAKTLSIYTMWHAINHADPSNDGCGICSLPSGVENLASEAVIGDGPGCHDF
jgi:hypothetical protein